MKPNCIRQIKRNLYTKVGVPPCTLGVPSPPRKSAGGLAGFQFPPHNHPSPSLHLNRCIEKGPVV